MPLAPRPQYGGSNVDQRVKPERRRCVSRDIPDMRRACRLLSTNKARYCPVATCFGLTAAPPLLSRFYIQHARQQAAMQQYDFAATHNPVSRPARFPALPENYWIKR
jgi:hypothetical protein